LAVVLLGKGNPKEDPKGNPKGVPKGNPKGNPKEVPKGDQRIFKRNLIYPLKIAILTIAVIILGVQNKRGITVTFLDVGQGDCICLQADNGEVYLFDGGSSSRSQAGKYIILPYLKQQGITYIDAIFISHPDSDHYNGIMELLAMGRESGVTVGRVVLPGIEESAREQEFGKLLEGAGQVVENGGVPMGEVPAGGVPMAKVPAGDVPIREFPISYVAAGNSWNSGNVRITCLHPAAGCRVADSNAYSQCFLVEYGGFSMLLTGDVEGEGENMLLRELIDRQVKDITLLKVAHHGSRYSTSEELLDVLRPKLAVISCGKNNRYGHPHEDLLERFTDYGTIIYATPQTGAIWVEISGEQGSISMFTYLKRY
jgi:competence protein ComEC